MQLKNMFRKFKIRWGRLLFTGMLFAVMVWSCYYFRRDFYVNATDNWYRRRILIYLSPMFLSLLCSQFRPYIPEKMHVLVRTLFVVVAIAAGAVAFQSLCWDTLWYGLGIQMRLDCMLLNLSLSAVIFALLWALIWDSRRAAITLYWLMSILGYAYRCVYEFRGSIFKITDLMTMETALAVAGKYSYRIQSEQVFWMACGVLLCIAFTALCRLLGM